MTGDHNADIKPCGRSVLFWVVFTDGERKIDLQNSRPVHMI